MDLVCSRSGAEPRLGATNEEAPDPLVAVARAVAIEGAQRIGVVGGEYQVPRHGDREARRLARIERETLGESGNRGAALSNAAAYSQSASNSMISIAPSEASCATTVKTGTRMPTTVRMR